jgi:hypothetical protein
MRAINDSVIVATAALFSFSSSVKTLSSSVIFSTARTAVSLASFSFPSDITA